jgi:Tfp pilus assembly protein PilF
MTSFRVFRGENLCHIILGRGSFGFVFHFGVAGCGVNRQERVRDYAEDGLHLYEVGDYRRARQSFEAALALAPGDVTLQYDLAQCYDRLGLSEKAENLYRDTLVRSPNEPEVHHALDVLLVREGRREEAVRMVQEWIAKAPGLSSPYAEDGYLWHDFGDIGRAEGRLYQALQLDPHDNRALIELGVIFEEKHYPDRAIVVYERALEYHPHQPAVEERLAQLRSQGIAAPHPE